MEVFDFNEFWRYLYQSAVGTTKTSEIKFADARLVLICALALIALLVTLLRKPVTDFGKPAVALLVFVGVSFVLWAALFAYQRYLIPVELLLGLVAWVLIARVFTREAFRVAALAGLIVLCAVPLKVPDWGHTKVDVAARQPFSLVLPERLASTPARYLVVGAPISYVLPYLHADSVFYGLNFSKQSRALIVRRIAEPSLLPVRIIAEDRFLRDLWKFLGYFGYTRDTHSLDCSYLSTAVGRYSACDVVAGRSFPAASGVIVNAAFAEADIGLKKGVLWESGFSYPEFWGRWTNSATAQVGLQACLPKGMLRVSITAQAFGANIGQPVRFTLGTQDQTATFGQSLTNTSLYFDNTQECADRLTVHIPAADAYAEGVPRLGSRGLGLGLTRIEIIKE